MAFKSRKRTSEAGGDFVQSRDEKRARTESTKNNSGSNFHQPDLDVNCKIDANGDHYWEISKMRRVTVSTFRGKTMVNIREYYEKDGQELPGKKVGYILLIYAFSPDSHITHAMDMILTSAWVYIGHLYADGPIRSIRHFATRY